MNKTIVITGGGAGLGKHLAMRLAADGAAVVLLGRTASKVETLAAEIGEGAMGVGCDVASPDSVRAAFGQIGQRHPTIDVLINNAAVYEPFTVEDATDEQVLASVLTNLAGPIFTTRSAIPMMKAGSHIINISSESVGLPFAMLSLYQASKAGLERFTESLKAELAPRSIRVTTVRAGQMMDEEKTSGFDPQVAMKFVEECAKRGVDLRSRPITHYKSVAEVFSTLINMQADLQTPFVSLEAWRS